MAIPDAQKKQINPSFSLFRRKGSNLENDTKTNSKTENKHIFNKITAEYKKKRENISPFITLTARRRSADIQQYQIVTKKERKSQSIRGIGRTNPNLIKLKREKGFIQWLDWKEGRQPRQRWTVKTNKLGVGPLLPLSLSLNKET